MYYVIFVTVGLCFGLSFALLNGAVTTDQYTLSLDACGAIGIQGAWIAMTRAPHKQR